MARSRFASIHKLEKTLIKRIDIDTQRKKHCTLHVHDIEHKNDKIGDLSLVLACDLPHINPHSKNVPKRRYRVIFGHPNNNAEHWQALIVDDMFYLQTRNKIALQSRIHPSWKKCLAEVLALPFFQVNNEKRWTSHYQHFTFSFLSPYRDNNEPLTFNPKPIKNTWKPGKGYSVFNLRSKNTILDNSDHHNELDAIQRFHAATDRDHYRILNEEPMVRMRRLMVSSTPVDPTQDTTSI